MSKETIGKIEKR